MLEFGAHVERVLMLLGGSDELSKVLLHRLAYWGTVSINSNLVDKLQWLDNLKINPYGNPLDGRCLNTLYIYIYMKWKCDPV